jgi:hypothetical protein
MNNMGERLVKYVWGARLSPEFWGTRASINTGGSYTWLPLKFLFLEAIVLIERL